MKKKIKVGFIGFWPDFCPENNIFINSIRKNFDVQVTKDNPDYIICSVFGNPYEYCKYPQVRIMYSGENYIPDFNLIDYAISSYPVFYNDRHFRLPQFILDNPSKILTLENLEKCYELSFLKSKIFFANFICGHESENDIRGDFFKKLCKYKRVESAGFYLNNMPDGLIVDREHKLDFQKKCKFTLCFESTKHEGFVTEKITDAFSADTIPVYYGSSDVNQIFNKNAFINVSDYASFDDAINKIIELDNDDEKYLAMLNQPAFVDNKYCEKIIYGLEGFFKNIFNQDYKNAYRRSRVYWAKRYNDLLINICDNTTKKNKKRQKQKERYYRKKDLKNDFKVLLKEKNIFFAILFYIKNYFKIYFSK